MPTIALPRKATGKELTEIIRKTAEELNFKYYDFSNEKSEIMRREGISISRGFPEHAPQDLRFAFDTTPYLEFKFGKIEPEKTYESLECSTMLGTMRMEPIDLDEKHKRYKPYYMWFVQGLHSHLQAINESLQ